MRGIGKIDPRRALRRDRDRANRRVETPLLQASEDRVHLRDWRQPVLPAKFLGDPAPEFDADPLKLAVRPNASIGGQVVHGDAQRLGFEPPGGRRATATDGEAEAKD